MMLELNSGQTHARQEAYPQQSQDFLVFPWEYLRAEHQAQATLETFKCTGYTPDL